MELLNEALERIGQEHQLRRQDPDAPPADGEAIFMDATRSGVQPIADAAANMQAGERAGAAAGIAAAAEYCAAFAAGLGTGKRAPPISPVSPAPQAGVELVAKKQKRGAKDKAKTALTGILAGGAASSAIVIAGSTPESAAAAGAAAAAAAAAAAPRAGAKIEPFAAGEPKANSITDKLDKAGGGLVEVLDRLHAAENPQARVSDFACPWMSTNGSCRDGDNSKCKKCANKTRHSAAVLSTAKAACTAELLNSLPAKSLVKAAA
jgi:hypothetical protein